MSKATDTEALVAMRHAAMETMVERMVAATKAALERALSPRDQRLRAIESRLDALEAAPVEFRGVHATGQSYPARSLVTRSGGLWFARAATDATPGTGSEWQLIVKRGTVDDRGA